MLRKIVCLDGDSDINLDRETARAGGSHVRSGCHMSITFLLLYVLFVNKLIVRACILPKHMKHMKHMKHTRGLSSVYSGINLAYIL